MGIGFKTKQVIKQAVQNVVLPVCYQANRGRKVDPKLVVFADAHHNSRPAAMELLYRKLKKRGDFRIIEHYLDYGTASAAEVAKHSTRFMQLYAAAGYVVICDNFLPVASCTKREETKVIQLWHACGCYKKFGYDALDDIPAGYHGANVYRNADLVTVSGKAAVKPFASAMRLPERCVKALGVSRTDLYFKKSWKERCTKQFYEKYPQALGKNVVLWAPTFRGNAGVPELMALDIKKLQQELGEEYLVLARLHPHLVNAFKRAEKELDTLKQTSVRDVEKQVSMEQGTIKQTGLEKTSAKQGNSGQGMITLEESVCEIPTEELYPIVDVLIADYSSLIYEYLLFRKPLVLYVPDLDEYRSKRGFYMDIEEIPGQIVTREKELASVVRKTPEQKEADAELDHFLTKYMGACDGNATDRIAAWMR